MPNIPLTRAEIVNPDGLEGVEPTPPLVLRVPHDVVDAICGKAEGEEVLQPSARSLVLYDFGLGTRLIAFEEPAETVRAILKSHPGPAADWSTALRTPAGEPLYLRRARYVTCECLPPAKGEEGEAQPRALVLFRTRAGEIKSFTVANTDEEIEEACQPLDPSKPSAPKLAAASAGVARRRAKR